MGVLVGFLRVGILGSQFQSESKAFALFIRWRILHLRKNYRHWKLHSMDLDLQELGFKFLAPMTSTCAITLKSLRTFGEVSFCPFLCLC